LNLYKYDFNFYESIVDRTNKLVDGCYSFWEAAVMPIIHTVMAKKSKIFSTSLYHSVIDLIDIPIEQPLI